ncbi:bifunctional 4-hydroxy-2-oxoglutarate aldolase/2-dehydro-3-deoxy-phosphogluconate aldolase [Actinoallomurus rhizosphaericola]|uniref:bifunctional 4-hydroxy-2-oxoglutarate aldolase/2-dehydro-3-deoxy-phosphogluconate aldolase n=1 Tax=Actinoallomurus rhizosphaericola TaxID=2952536 RepID=UPI0020903DA8|nr:bifunctional 4-hydroxy-2-oxoglutarate aldolase/2-dehydro-3-deoxy-phosphogluconate aldolase [Actinoallomurus rhizosphaericola]MCO5994105.1 bifunctional 4-hydroxy-2-oxoglutarate aldolase/2-dehydro-3-deoxy-phosphogluconate aldolase [Actinoallomurus rhizosphaericola]
MDQAGIERAIGASRVVPVLRTPDADGAVRAAETLLAAGLTVIELTATTPGWADALAGLRRAHPAAVLGAGTVTTAEDARRALDTGADFLVSPYPAEAVRAVAAETGTVFLEGGFTPGEVAAAAGRGIAKLFPAHVGGPAYLRSVLAVLPGARIVPTGGIALTDVPAYLDAGAYAVGVGSDLVKAPDPAKAVRELLGAAK